MDKLTMKHCLFQGHEWRDKLGILNGRLVTVQVCEKCEKSRYPKPATKDDEQ